MTVYSFWNKEKKTPIVAIVPYVDAVSHWMGSRKGSSVGTFNSTT